MTGVVAGWLVGGFAVGEGDAFSDVDLQCGRNDRCPLARRV